MAHETLRVLAWIGLGAGCGRLNIDAQAHDAGDVLDAPDQDAAEIDAALAPPCGASVLFVDELDDTAASPLFAADADPGLTLNESGGHLDIVFSAAVAVNNFAFYNSTAVYPLADLCVVAELSMVPTNGGHMFFKLITSGQREVEFIATGTTIDLRTQLNMGVDQKRTIPRVPSERFWRFRRQGTNIYWDLSSDGITYLQHFDMPGFLTGADARILIGAGTALRDTTVPAIARYESIRATGP